MYLLARNVDRPARCGVPRRPGVRVLADPRAARVASAGAGVGLDADRAVGAASVFRDLVRRADTRRRSSRSRSSPPRSRSRRSRTATSSISSRSPPPFVVVYELASRAGRDGGPAAHARRACRGVGGHPRLRRRRGVGLRVGASAVRIRPPVRRLDDVQRQRAVVLSRRRRPCGCGRRGCTATSFPSGSCFPGWSSSIAPAAALWPGRATAPRRDALRARWRPTAFVLSLGPEPSAWSHRLLPSGPYLWLARIVPGMDGLRVPARLSVARADGAQRARGVRRWRVCWRCSRPRAARVAVVALGVGDRSPKDGPCRWRWRRSMRTARPERSQRLSLAGAAAAGRARSSCRFLNGRSRRR